MSVRESSVDESVSSGADRAPEGRKRGRGGRGAGPVRENEHSDSAQSARDIVLRRLAMGDRTRAELQTVLTDKGIPGDVQASVLDRFEELDLINDASLAHNFASSRSASGRGRRAIAYKLRTRGVADDTIEEALAEISTDDEIATATDLVRRRWPRLLSVDRNVRSRRLYGMLARRGYSPTVVSEAIRAVEQEESHDQD